MDSTLREGEQTLDACFHEHTRLAIARQLDRVDVSILEADRPVVTPRSMFDYVQRLKAALAERGTLRWRNGPYGR